MVKIEMRLYEDEFQKTKEIIEFDYSSIEEENFWNEFLIKRNNICQSWKIRPSGEIFFADLDEIEALKVHRLAQEDVLENEQLMLEYILIG